MSELPLVDRTRTGLNRTRSSTPAKLPLPLPAAREPSREAFTKCSSCRYDRPFVIGGVEQAPSTCEFDGICWAEQSVLEGAVDRALGLRPDVRAQLRASARSCLQPIPPPEHELGDSAPPNGARSSVGGKRRDGSYGAAASRPSRGGRFSAQSYGQRTLDSRRRWTTREQCVEAIRAHAARREGIPPTASEWSLSTSDHPNYNRVVRLFGTWNAGIAAAGFEPIVKGSGKTRRPIVRSRP